MQQRYDPANASVVEMWPDPLLSTSSPAGVGLDPSPDKAMWIRELNSLLAPSLEQASEVGGFARSGGVLFRFTADVDVEDAVRFIDLERGQEVPFELEQSQDGTMVMIQPIDVLAPGARHVVAVTKSATSSAGCVGPSPIMEQLIAGAAPEPRFEAVAGDYPPAIDGAGLEASQVIAATTFMTHGDHGAVVHAAEHARAQSYEWASAPTCEPGPGQRRCEASFEANDYRHDLVVANEPAAQARVPVTFTLPSATGPRPLLLFGHGLGGNRHNLDGADAIAEELGIVVVAMDALRHGDHPTAAAISETAFLGLDVSDEAPLDTLALKSNFNQTSLDRLQLVELLKANPDIDGDGSPDIDVDHIGYWGISLGGLLGPGTLAISDDIEIAILSVGGGKLTRFVQDSTEVEELLGLLATLLGGPDELNALMVVMQSVVDGGDPMTWGAHVLRDRPLGGEGPHLLLPLAMFDDVVPPSTGKALARALRAPQVMPVTEAVAPLPSIEAPVTGNVDGRTVGYFQLDRIGDPPQEAQHGTPSSAEAMLQARHFLETWMTGTPEIIDPYEALGTPPL